MADRFPSLVMETKGGIRGGVMMAGTELSVAEERKVINLSAETSGDNFFQDLSAAFQ